MKKSIVRVLASAVVITVVSFGAGLPIQLSPTVALAQTTCKTDPSFTVGTTTETITSGGMERTFLLHVPAVYKTAIPTDPVPLVVTLHGSASTAEQQMKVSEWDKLADQESFLVVAADGAYAPQRWNAGDSNFIGASRVDDVQFFKDIVKNLSGRFCIDPARIFVNGYSNGGGMTNRLACENADQVAAIGTVAGAYSALAGGCKPSRPVPVIAFHGTADPVVRITGIPTQDLPPIAQWVLDWAIRNGCSKTPTVIAAKGDVSGQRYTGCKDDSEVVYYQIDGGGHTWPGGPVILELLGKVSKDINATQEMWAFYQKHPLKK